MIDPVQQPQPASFTRASKGVRALMFLMLLAVGAALAWHTTGDLDLPLHDRTGQEILSGQGVPRTNLYSFTAPDHRWVDHEWLFQVVVAAVGNLAGDGLEQRSGAWQWLRLVLALTLLACLGRDLAAARAHPTWLVGGVGLLALSLLWTRLTLRPELISATLLVAVLWRVEAALRDRRPVPAWRRLIDPRLPTGQATWLTCLWYQVHGFAALAALIWILAAGLDRQAGPWRGRFARAGVGLAGALLAGLLTPHGIAGLIHPLHVMRQDAGDLGLQQMISELVPLLQTTSSLGTTIILFKASLVWSVLWLLWSWPRVSLLRAALWLLALAAAWQGQRNLGLYAVALVLLHGGPVTEAANLGERVRHWWRQRPWSSSLARAALVLPVALVVVAGFWLGAIVNDRFYLQEGVARRFGPGLTPAIYPQDAATVLADRGVERVAVTINAASTVIAARAGRVSIDGRTEAYPAEAWRQYQQLRAGGDGALRQLARWRADAVCLAHRGPSGAAIVRTLEAAPGWQLIQADAAGVAYVPSVAPLTSPGEPWRQAAEACLERLTSQAERRQVRLADEAVAWAGLLDQLGGDPLGEDLLRAAVRACPDHPVALHNLGNLLLARGEHRAALPRFEAAARLNRNAAPPLVNAGSCLFHLGRHAEAARAFAAATDRDPRNFEAWANLAEARRSLGDRDGAGAAYRRALSLRPDDRRLRDRARTL
jgi:tetratricopeptide (TPR) repeat protein